MQSRRDLFQAHRLMTRRAALALLGGEPDIPDQPLRRLNVATISGVLVGVIVVALFGLLGLLFHGGQTLQRQPGTLVIDKETGASYVFCQGGKLCPVLNYASARLALRSSAVTQQVVSQASLTRYARGPLIGIQGLPQPLPASSLLIRQPWSVCTRTVVTVAGPQAVTAVAGGIGTGGRLLGRDALLMRALGQDWVVWHGQRMLIKPALLAALSAAVQPVAVPTVWLNAVPEGPDFAPPAIPDRGARVPGPAGGAVSIGQVYVVSAVAGSPPQYYVMLQGGLAPISETQAVLLDFEAGTPKPRALSPSLLSGHLSAVTEPAGGLPGQMPAVAAASQAAPMCVVYAGGRTLSRQIMLGGQMPSGGTPTGNPAGVTDIALPAGAGALVGAAPGTGQSKGAISYFLVSGGHRYALASQGVAAMLGYDLPRQAVLLPASVVSLIPQGPALDPAQATRPVTPGG
jgi:type VII secretion protein EccB